MHVLCGALFRRTALSRMLEAQDLSFSFGPEPVFEGVNLNVAPGEIVGLSGPSGVGKSTLSRVLCGHLDRQSGRVTLDGEAVACAGFYPVQLLTQTPIFSVNPRWTVGKILNEAWAPDEATCQALRVSPSWLERYPHELSGGELQRVSIARALAPPVRYLVADEITAMLDPITQAEIWTYLIDVVKRRGIGILAIIHDNALLERVAGRTICLA